MKRQICLVTALLSLSLGCSERGFSVDYTATGGGASALLGKARSACELAMPATLAGRFRVDSITGVYEEVDGEWEPHTYLELKLLEGWGGRAEDFTARISGGPLPDGSQVAHFIEVEKDEVVALVLNDPPDWNGGYRFIEIQQLFRDDGDEVTNGRVHARAVELSAVFKTAIEERQCPKDIAPTAPEPSEDEKGPEPSDDFPEDGTWVVPVSD